MTPAIQSLLDQYAALLLSPELTFDEKVGYFTGLSIYSPNHHGMLDPNAPLRTRADAIRNGMIELQTQRARAMTEKQQAAWAQETQAQKEKQTARKERPARDYAQEIETEREAIARISQRLQSDPQALENLQLHLTRLQVLERKAKAK